MSGNQCADVSSLSWANSFMTETGEPGWRRHRRPNVPRERPRPPSGPPKRPPRGGAGLSPPGPAPPNPTRPCSCRQKKTLLTVRSTKGPPIAAHVQKRSSCAPGSDPRARLREREPNPTLIEAKPGVLSQKDEPRSPLAIDARDVESGELVHRTSFPRRARPPAKADCAETWKRRLPPSRGHLPSDPSRPAPLPAALLALQPSVRP